MPQVTIDMDEETDKKVRLFMVYNNMNSKADTIIQMLKEFKVEAKL